MAWVLATLLAAGCALSKAEEAEERSVPLGTGQAVHVTTRNGRIDIRTGQKGRVRLKAIKRARASSNPEALLKEIKVKITPGADRLLIAAEHPSGGLSKQYGVSFELTVPAGTVVRAESRNGAVRVAGTGAAVHAETRNGAVRVTDARGEAWLRSRNGALSLSGQPTRFDVESGNGAIRVLLDPATILRGASSIVTRNGAITLEAPPTFKGGINAATVNGRVHSDFPTRRKAGPGEPSLRIRTRNGSIRIRKP